MKLAKSKSHAIDNFAKAPVVQTPRKRTTTVVRISERPVKSRYETYIKSSRYKLSAHKLHVDKLADDKLSDDELSDDELSDDKLSDDKRSSDLEQDVDDGDWMDESDWMGEEEIETDRTVSTNNPLDEDFFDISSLSLSAEVPEDTIEAVESFVQPQHEESKDFFEKLGKVLDIRQISTSTLDQSMRMLSALSMSSSDYGKFVDPLTGKSAGTVEEETISKHTEEQEVDHKEKEPQWDIIPVLEEYSFEDFDIRFPVPPEKPLVSKPEDDFVVYFLPLHSLLSEKAADVPVLSETVVVATGLVEQTEKFLNDIIKYVIHFCEHEQGANLIRKQFDKKALFQEIRKVVFELDVERKVNFFLNRKCIDYCRRKGRMRSLQEEKNRSKHLQDVALYREKIEILRSLLAKECAMFKKTQKQVSDLSQKVEEDEENNRLEIKAFEIFVKKTVKCHLNPSFEKFVSTQLRYMATLREEISATRCVIIQRQHTLATLLAKLHELENIGNGLRLIDYENLTRDMRAFDKKIEDRSHELAKMHARFHNNLHSMTHIKLKNETSVNIIGEQLQELRELKDEEYLTRHRLFYLNLMHRQTRRHLENLSHQSGLLDKPALLHDYDETSERLQKQRNKVKELKKIFLELKSKMKQLETPEKMPSNTNTNNADVSESSKHKSILKPIVGLQGISLGI